MGKKKSFSPFITNFDDSELQCDEYCDKKKKVYKCSVCCRKLSSKDILKKHILHKHIKLKPYSCDLCSKKFILERELLRHQPIHDDTTAFKCFCGVVFKKKCSLKYHELKLHTPNISLKCPICLKTYKDWQLKNHIRSSHFSQCFRCLFDSCKKIFSTKTNLRLHQMTHSKTRYECSVCKKKFKLQHYKEIHEKSHNGFRPFKCKECNKAYLTLSHLNCHQRKEHLEVRNFLCSACGKTFKTNFEVISHERSHKDKVFSCDDCDFKASTRKLLNIHKKTHLNANSLINLSSRASAGQEMELQKKNIPHYIINSSEKSPYRCLDCEKSFKSAVRANEHWRRYHLIKETLKCSFCPKLFRGKSELSEHLKSSHQEIVYKCKVCPFTTQFKIALFSHNKRHKLLGENEQVKELEEEENKFVFCQRVEIEKQFQNDDSTPDKIKNIIEEKFLVSHEDENISLENGSRDKFYANNENGDYIKPEKDMLPSINTHALRRSTCSTRREKRQKQNGCDSLTSDIKMTYYGDEDYKGISHLFGEAPLLSYLDIEDDQQYMNHCRKVLNNNSFETKKQTANLQSPYKSKKFCDWNGFKVGPKVTLNCTAANDLEGSGLFEI